MVIFNSYVKLPEGNGDHDREKSDHNKNGDE
jgi:hypothetical protein